jgi:peptide methionine sulfoxide reductase msrA/msrB
MKITTFPPTWLLFFAICVGSLQTGCAQTNKKPSAKTAIDRSLVTPIVQFDTTWTTKIVKTQAEWKAQLTPEQFHITQEQGTERPFTCALNKMHDAGVFYCVCCQNPLFGSTHKFDSGTGWPSYNKPLSTKSVTINRDETQGMVREEVACQRCGAHLGHVFEDGPPPTGLRYCIDGVALIFQAKKLDKNLSKATFAAGCFWCEGAVFQGIKGVEEAVAGYAGGKEQNPTYEQVGSGKTGHAEAFEVYYDAKKISYADLLRVYFASINPVQVNGQGPDSGAQYRSIIFCRNDDERKQASDFVANLAKSGKYSQPITVEIKPFERFWQAEDYHQNYVELNPENPYVKQESIPRRARTYEQIKDLVK